MAEFTDERFWDAYHARRGGKARRDVLFAELFDRFLTPDPSRTVLEVGCAGGEFLCHLAERFGYRAWGVDSSRAIATTRERFRERGLPAPRLVQADFFSWRPGRRFDVVCSFGFVEHFEDLPAVVRRHADLVAPGGKLIVSMPHFAGLQYLFHWLIDRPNLRRHNTSVMNLRALRRALAGLPFTVDHLAYYRTFGFWTERPRLARWERAVLRGIRLFGRVLKKALGRERPNPLVSPHLILIATSRERRAGPEGRLPHPG